MKIAIDPGHGMGNARPGVFDPGAVVRTPDGTLAEAELVLGYGLALRRMLRASGVAVFMTRASRATPAPLRRRVARATRAGCSHLVSLHLNAAKRPDARGAETLFGERTKDARFAELLQRALVSATGFVDRGCVERSDLLVTRFDAGPCALLELGFLTNEGDRAVLVDRARREQCCRAIADALLAEARRSTRVIRVTPRSGSGRRLVRVRSGAGGSWHDDVA